METPSLVDALRAKFQALEADFGRKAADRLREVVEHALAQVTGRSASGGRPRGATARKPGRRAWTPEQKEEQRRKMRTYWASRKKEKGSSSRGKRGRAKAPAPAAESSPAS
jgi:hypothetical protein